MSWSQTQQSEDLYDQITILIGSAIRLLSGDAGVFVVSKEAFDPQSNTEYALYRLSESALMPLLSHISESEQPDTHCPLVIETIPSTLVKQLEMCDEDSDLLADLKGAKVQPILERCSLFVSDHAGVLGELHYLRPADSSSCFEHSDESNGALHLFITHFAAGLRSALKWQSLIKEQRRLAAIFQQSDEGILTVDTALRIIDFNPAMERLTGWRESEVLGRVYYEVLRPKDRLGNELGFQDSLILQAFAGQMVVNREMIISARDGQQFDTSVAASCVRSSKGEPTSGILPCVTLLVSVSRRSSVQRLFQ
jgi:PAS domain S-box-containing protein